MNKLTKTQFWKGTDIEFDTFSCISEHPLIEHLNKLEPSKSTNIRNVIEVIEVIGYLGRLYNLTDTEVLEKIYNVELFDENN